MAGSALLLLFAVGLLQRISCSEVITDNVECGPTDTTCECDPGATVCSFKFFVQHVFTFAKYNVSIPYIVGQGERFYIDDEGNAVSYTKEGICMEGDFVKQTGSDLYCNATDACVEKSKLCTEILSVDGKTFKTVIAVNKQFPGPTLIVTEGQIVSVDVHNNLSTESISIHWHGQHLKNLSFMDGVAHVTQCPISPGDSFRYIFKAEPSGTFWYHAQKTSQREKGLFGALIVREKEPDNGDEFIDDPASHTLVINDFYRQDHEEFYQSLEFILGLYPGIAPFEFPSDINEGVRYFPSVGPDATGIGVHPFWSALINGRGRHSEVPYNRSRLSVFEVDSGKSYRFRVINAASTYAFRFSIHGHKLKVIAADGYRVESTEVDFVLVELGERYDILVEAKQESGDYGIRAETIEISGTTGPPPFEFRDHKVEAILHYSTSPTPKSTQYEEIFRLQRKCIRENPCKMLNCPFKSFHSSYNIECISIDQLRLTEPTPEQDMPDTEPEFMYFINLGGFINTTDPLNSINDNHFIFPQFPVTTSYNRVHFVTMTLSVTKQEGVSVPQ